MTESSTIHDDKLPLTFELLVQQFAVCGLAAGQTVLVHTRMSSMGWIVGGAVDVIRALLHVLTPSGTLMMPTHTSGNTDPKNWENPPVPEHWWPIIREHRPAFDARVTPTREMGAVAELFRTWPGVARSEHPIGSFAALGPTAVHLTENHRLANDIFGDQSPIGKLYKLDGYVLLLGVDHENNTSLHLADHRATWLSKSTRRDGTAMIVNGVRRWVEFDAPNLETDDFNAIGTAYEAQNQLPIHKVGQAEVRFLRQRPLVDFAVEWIEQNRK